ncbi:MAG: hypothetical protein ACLFQX_08250 [Candidatus Kapaibacterium sp.]
MTYTEKTLATYGAEAAEAIDTLKRFMKINSSGKLEYAGLGDRIAGAASLTVEAGEQAGYKIPGSIAVITSGGSISAGADVMSDANAKAVTFIKKISEKIKSEDESKASDTTYADDAALSDMPALAGKSYKMSALINLVNAKADVQTIKAKFTAPADATIVGNIYAVGAVDGNLTLLAASADLTAEFTHQLTASESGALIIEAIVTIDATAGNIALQWAQNASDAADLTVKAGSYLKLERTDDFHVAGIALAEASGADEDIPVFIK